MIAAVSDVLQELLNRDAGCANQRTESANGEFLVLRNREVGALPSFTQYQVAAYLAKLCQPIRAKAFAASFPEILASLDIGSSRSWQD